MAEAGVGFNPADLSDVMLPIPDWSSDDEDETKIEATDSSSDVCSNTPFQISLSIPSSTTTRVTDEALAERVGAGPTAASLPPPDTAHADGLWCPPAAPTLNRVAVRRLLDQLCGEVVAHTSDTSAAAALKGGGAACALTEVSIDKVLGDLEAWAAAGLPGASPHGAQSAELHPILLAARAHLLHHCDNHSAAVAGWAWARRAWYQATNRPEPAPWRFDAHLACIAEQSARGRRAYTVDSRAAAALPLGEFHSRYSQQQQPVLITGLGPHLVPELGVGWLLKSVGSKRVGVYTHGSHRGSAPRSRLMLMSELLEAIHTGTGSATADSLYLYDVSIPKQLPGLLEHLRIPRYFVHDFLTRTMHPHPWSLNWPSLFVGSVGTCSSIHVDQWHGSFWMVMVAGRKRWTLWHPADTAMLYPAWRRGRLAPEFPSLESLEGQSDTYPLFHQARRTVVVVGPGDVLFVPGGTPHFVENLTPTVAYAGNFLDEGNFDAALEDMQLLGLLSEPIREAAASIGATDFSLPAPPLGGDAPPLRPEHQVVHYHDYVSGEAATWHGPPPTPVAFDTALWGQGGPHSAVDPPAAPLSAVVHAPLSAVPSSMEADVAALLKSLEEDGYVILRGALPLNTVAALRADLQAELAAAIATEHRPPGTKGSSFAKINSREHRHDLRLLLDDSVCGAVRTIISGKYSAVYSGVLPSDAKLVELGVITSHPGAQQQTIHSDVDFDASARRVFTSFVALQDIDSVMGPTQIWPSTHSEYWCQFYKPTMLGPVDPYYDRNPPDEMVARAGDVVLMDTRVMHCGGENQSDSDRMLAHFSFESTAEPNAPCGFTYNLHETLREKHTLASMG